MSSASRGGLSAPTRSVVTYAELALRPPLRGASGFLPGVVPCCDQSPELAPRACSKWSAAWIRSPKRKSRAGPKCALRKLATSPMAMQSAILSAQPRPAVDQGHPATPIWWSRFPEALRVPGVQPTHPDDRPPGDAADMVQSSGGVATGRSGREGSLQACRRSSHGPGPGRRRGGHGAALRASQPRQELRSRSRGCGLKPSRLM